MSRADTLVKIKEAESKAQEIIKEAEERQVAILSSARKDAVKTIQEAEDRIKSSYDQAFGQEKARVASQREEQLRKGKEEADRLRSKASSNIPKAKKYLMDRFERTFDASS